MVDPNDFEAAALRAAGQKAGEWFELQPTTDLRKFTVEQYETMVEVIVSAYQDEVGKQWEEVQKTLNRIMPARV